MAFRGTNNLPRPEEIKRCQFGGTNNSKKKGGCGKHVEKLGQMVHSRTTGDTWHVWYHLNFCVEHRNHVEGEYERISNQVAKGLFVGEGTFWIDKEKTNYPDRVDV